MTRKLNPQIGIFWEIYGELVFRAVATERGVLTSGIRDIEADHFSHWEYLASSLRRDLQAYSYDHFPRGRVLFKESERVFVILGDRCLLARKGFVVKLRRAFGLPPNVLVDASDGHYKCHRCNPDFVSDESIFE